MNIICSMLWRNFKEQRTVGYWKCIVLDSLNALYSFYEILRTYLKTI